MTTADSDGVRAQLSKSFGELLDDKLMEECVALCQNYDLTGEALLYKWEAMSFGVSPRVFNADTVLALKHYIQRDIVKQEKQKLSARSTGIMSRNLNARVLPSGSLRSSVANTTSVPNSRRADSMAAGPSRVKLEINETDYSSHKGRRYRYMYEKISERSSALDDRIDEIAALVQKHYDLSDLSDPSTESEEEVTVVGRIALDADSSSAGPVKLNEASMVLESSRTMGSGKRVPLRFDVNVRVRGAVKGVQGAGFFPGAIVALRGRNGGGGWFLVAEILALPPPKHHSRGTSGPDLDFSMVIASGPFTSDADLNYEIWEAFVNKLKASKPAAILLIGPFVDSNHALVKDGDLHEPPEALFRRIFLDPLSEVLDELAGSIALIVPSVRDLLGDHAVFPQGELHLESRVDSRITMLPNPAQFKLNGLSFGVCSMDVLFHLRKEEMFKRASEIGSIDGRAQQADAMAGLCRHVTCQRSFYPLFPAPLDTMHETNLDISHFDYLQLCDSNGFAPDVIILPSKLKQFVKNVDDIHIINPSSLLKGISGVLSYDSVLEKVSIDLVKN